MKKKRLGRTELMVSEMGLGGIPVTRLDLDRAVALIRYAFARGVTFFDTAILYGDSERKMGAALKDVREQVILATKTMARDGAGATKHVETSLAKLETDYIDLYQIHNISTRETLQTVLAPGGAFESLARAQDDGKVRHIGFTSHNVDVAVTACGTGQFSTVQIPFNVIEHDPAEKLFPEAREQDMGIIAMKPLGGGLLDRVRLCFGFLREHRDVIPIPGVASRAELRENLTHYLNPKRLTEEDRAEIHQMRSELGPAFCHRCEYCQPCPEGIEIPRVLLFKSQSKRFSKDIALKLGRESMVLAEDCAQCGECEDKCPYGLPVRELIRESLAYYRRFCEAFD